MLQILEGHTVAEVEFALAVEDFEVEHGLFPVDHNAAEVERLDQGLADLILAGMNFARLGILLVHAAGGEIVKRVTGSFLTVDLAKMHVATDKDHTIGLGALDEIEEAFLFAGMVAPHLPVLALGIEFDHLYA